MKTCITIAITGLLLCLTCGNAKAQRMSESKALGYTLHQVSMPENLRRTTPRAGGKSIATRKKLVSFFNSDPMSIKKYADYSGGKPGLFLC